MSRDETMPVDDSLEIIANSMGDILLEMSEAKQALDRIAGALEGLLDRQVARDEREQEEREQEEREGR